jgi:hypothetical protein
MNATPNEAISVTEFCLRYGVEQDFIRSLNESGLVRLISMEEELCINYEALPQVEKLLRMHYEMEINLEGIEAIVHLLSRIDSMQQEIARLTNRLRCYEDI